jgi:nicotinamide phosphoribosyltransferase
MNILTQTDSYKYSHYDQYKEGTTEAFSYIEARGGKYKDILFFGLQAFIKEYLSKPFTQADIDEAQLLVDAHIGPGVFNREGFQYILDEYNGYFPVEIKAMPEGTVAPALNAMVTIRSTDPKCIWVPSFLETMILRAVWYPTTVATNSYTTRQVIKSYLDETSSSAEGLNFSLHDFGARGVSSSESAMLGGMGHLAAGFMGTDTVEAIVGVRKYYSNDPSYMPAFSVAAMEHSTVTIYGKENEVDAYRNMIKRFGGPNKIVACVSDSYDIYYAVEDIWGKELKDEVIELGKVGGKVVIRPDSGDPATVVLKVVSLLDKAFGTTTNEKGYKELPPYIGVIQGDGITKESIEEILETLKAAGYASSNVVFGQGGALLQQVNRDTSKYAMKTSAAVVDGEEMDVFKDPITDTGKRSKKGFITLYQNKETGEYLTTRIGEQPNQDYVDVLEPVYRNGEVLREQSFEDIRARSA